MLFKNAEEFAEWLMSERLDELVDYNADMYTRVSGDFHLILSAKDGKMFRVKVWEEE